MNKPKIKKLLKQYDTDGIPDGCLDLKEFEAFWNDMQD